MVNSEAYLSRLSDDGEIETFEHIPYFNVGLLTGQSKLTGRASLRYKPIQDYYRVVMEGASDRLRAHFRFLQLNRSTLDLFTKRGEYNLFVSRFFGGLDFPVFEEVRPFIGLTAFQKRFGRFLSSKVRDQEGSDEVTKNELGLVTRTEGRQHRVTRYHYRRVHLLPSGSTAWNDRKVVPLKDYGVRPPLFDTPILEPELKLVHPRISTLREFRRKNCWKGTVRSLLTQELEYFEEEVPVYDDEVRTLAVRPSD
jgi:hypothetical protein